jgi:AraC-like DNA-binding protein
MARERVLPTGAMHLVIRLSDPLRVYDALDDPDGRVIGHAIVGGARESFYVRDISQPAHSVGAVLYPGAAELLIGLPASELAGRHTALEELWGRSASEARERMVEAASLPRALDLFESLLSARLSRASAIHPAIADALERFTWSSDVSAAVRRSGYSHRRFIEMFRRAVGLSPKLYCRVQRFQAALARARSRSAPGWADVALSAGYSDQSHFNRDFREFAGISPGNYRELSPLNAQHVPVSSGREHAAARAESTPRLQRQAS